ncbi:MAG: alpha/beta hydrolase [Bdellovibrionaceae bacterium]|nr:alpha/beta hydrolase [Pseudobdellovibrionaceae bacterium]
MARRALSVSLMFTLALAALGCAATALKSQAPGDGYDARLSRYEYPFAVQNYSLKSQDQDLQMSYMDISPPSAPREIVVLLHGKNFGGFYFKSMIAELVSRGYRVIAVDQVGFGKSSKPRAYQFTFQSLASNTRALLQSLGVQRFQLVGHSMGGMLAVRYALMHPHDVTQLVLINPIGLEDWKTMVPYKTVGELYQVELSQTVDKARDYQKQSYYDGAWSESYEELLQPLTGWLKNREYPLVAWNSALTSDMIFTQPVLYEFKNIAVPTTLVIGLRDRTAIGRDMASDDIKKKMGLYTKLGKAAQKLIPGSKLIEMEGVGHVPFIEAPEKFWKATEVLWPRQ